MHVLYLLSGTEVRSGATRQELDSTVLFARQGAAGTLCAYQPATPCPRGSTGIGYGGGTEIAYGGSDTVYVGGTEIAHGARTIIAYGGITVWY
eukprot:1106993-Rhodomonas_salina.2